MLGFMQFCCTSRTKGDEYPQFGEKELNEKNPALISMF
jgi:hypothetical protein